MLVAWSIQVEADLGSLTEAGGGGSSYFLVVVVVVVYFPNCACNMMH